MNKIYFKTALKIVLYKLVINKKCFCVLCARRVSGFLSYRGGRKNMPRLPLALGMIGSNVDAFGCPSCGGHDRERHLCLYMQAAGFFKEMEGKSVLHFAPERQLAGKIQASNPGKYIKCDLFPDASDVVRVDMLAMDFPDNVFDILIANHVLEHVADDVAALLEIYRVLKPGGYAILQTPYCERLYKSWSDPGIDSDAARLEAYGQEDHVRLYGRDIFNIFESSGLVSCVRHHEELLSNIRGEIYGLNESEPFFLFKK